MADESAKLWTIVKREYLERVRTRWFLIGTLLGPLFFAAIIFLPMALSRHPAPAAAALAQAPGPIILDATGAGLGDHVARVLDADPDDDVGPADVRVVPLGGLAAAESLAAHDVLDRAAAGYLTLDSATVGGGGPRYVTRQTGPGSGIAGEVARLNGAVHTGLVALRLERRGLDADAVDSLTAGAQPVRVERIATGHGSANDAKVMLAAFVAFFLYISIVMYGQSMLSGVIEEKLSRVAEVVISSVRPETLLAGKVLGVSAVGLTQQLIWVAGGLLLAAARRAFEAGTPAAGAHDVMEAALGMAVRAAPTWWIVIVVLFFLLGFIFFGSLYAAIGSTVNSETEARQASQPVILLLLTTAIFIQPALSNPDGTVTRVMSILPFASPILMPLRMALGDVPTAEVALSAAVLAFSCAGAVWLAARIYRIGLLMYGKRPTLRELARWVRG